MSRRRDDTNSEILNNVDEKRTNRPFGSQVFEPGSECIKVLYNRPSSCIVAQFLRVTQRKIPLNELYYRRSSDSDYTKVENHDPFGSYCDPVSCKGKPYVFFNIVKWGKGGVGFDWASVAKLSLPDGIITRPVDRDRLKLPAGSTRGWIASLLDVNEEGTVVTCTLAFETTTHPHSGKVEYAISDLDLATGEHVRLAALPNVFV